MLIESAWPSHPGYRVDLVPLPAVARVRHGDVVLAESTAALRIIETDHVERLYFPMVDVRVDLLESNTHHSVCPFKGQADYWSFTGERPIENLFWCYPDPFPEVAGLRGYLGVYHEKVEVEVETRWGDDPRAVDTTRFPMWGDEADLLALIDAQPGGANRYVAPGYHERSRNVVEGGQLLAQAIVAAARSASPQRVTWASMTFPKAASFDSPIDLTVDTLRRGKTFSSVAVRAEQDGKLVAPALVLLDAGAPDTIHHTHDMPDVPGPYDSPPKDMRVSGRAIRVVEGAYSPDPDQVGPPIIYAWLRFRDNPAELYLRRALVAQASTHWTVAAAMRPHPGFGEAQAHVTLSTGIMAATIAFHDDVPLNEWLLYANPAIWSGQGLAQGEGRIFTGGGDLVASYSVQAMIRGFSRTPDVLGMDATNAM
jgi:acyl-CoA thioesterase II